MASQFVSTNGSNLFFEQDMWIWTGPEQHIRNKSTTFLSNEELTVENDEIQNNSGEHEDKQAILEYDTTDLDENESDLGDDNDEYQSSLIMIQIPMLELDTLHLMTIMKHIQLMSLLKHVLFRNFMGMRQIMNLPK